MIYREITLGNALLRTYVLSNYKDMDPGRRRAMIIICPGGGYHFCSEREAESVAIRFNSLGYNACVLYYTVNEGGAEKGGIYPLPQQELASAVKWVRENAAELNTDHAKIAVLGFSAGGHLAASLGVFWKEFGGVQCRPDAMVLCYPVITSGPLAHRGSIANLIGDREELLEKVSLEKQVSPDTPPAFIWTTRTDQSVPYENSTMFKQALDACGVQSDIHIYPVGRHGLSLGTEEVMGVRHMETCPEIYDWPERADAFLVKVFGSRF